MFDVDNSGTITKDEIENVFEKLGAPNIDAECKLDHTKNLTLKFFNTT